MGQRLACRRLYDRLLSRVYDVYILERRGLVREIAEVGFDRVRKLSKYAGTMQVVEARKGGDEDS